MFEQELMKQEKEVAELLKYESMIETPEGKAEFWKVRTLVSISQHELSMMLVEHVNRKYTPDEEE